MASLDGYVAAPSVEIAVPTPIPGVTGKQATAAAIMGVDTIAVTTSGSGYSLSPSVVINGGGGAGATATVTSFSLNTAPQIQILSFGSGYKPGDTITFVDGGTTAAVPEFFLSNSSQIVITTGGTGYTTGDALNFTNGGGAVGTVIASGGVITGINLTSPGTNLTDPLTISVDGPGTGAVLDATFPNFVISLTTPGIGITDLPQITVTSLTGTGAVLTPLLGVESITIANTGLGYTALPSITITDANGAGAAAAVTDLEMFGVALANNLAGGAGYQSAPTITVGRNTAGIAPTVTSTLSTLFTSTARGSNYTEPSVTYAANAGSTGVGGYVISGFTGGVNGIVTAGGPITLSFNDLEVQGLLPAEVGYGTANATQLTTVDTTSGGANNPANITIQSATGTETGGFSVVNGLPIKGSPIPINIGSTALPDANNGNINLSQGDLDTFIGQQLTIGRNSTVGFEAGPITVSAAVIMNPVNIPVMKLVSGGEISDLGTASGIARSNTLGVGVSFRLGLDAFGDIGLVGSGNNVDVLAAQTANRASNVRYVDQTGITIGTSGDIVGILAKTFYLQAGAGLVSGNIGQESGAEIQASNLSLRVGTVGAGIANSRAVLNQQNEVSNFAADFNTAAGTSLYFRNSTDLKISNISAGQPNNNPPAVQGVRATSVQIVNGGDLTQQDMAPMLVSGSLIISVLDGGNIILPSSLNIIPTSLVVGAVKADGTAGTVNDLNLRSIGAITVGNSGVFVLSLLTSGAGYNSTPNVAFSGAGGATATASMEVGTITVGSAGSAYVIAPTVSITPNGLDTTGSGAAAVATIDENPLSATYGQVKTIVLTSTGTNYTLAPSVTLSGGGGSGASASATLEIANLILTASGTTYLITPTVTISGGGATTQGTAQAAITTTAAGLTGDLTLVAGGAISQTLLTKNAISVAGNTTLTETSGLGINLSNSGNNLVGTVTISQGGGGNVALVNSSSLVLGNIGPIAATPVVPMGNLSLTSLGGSIYQNGTGTSLTVGGNSTFLAQTSTGTPNGAVILNNLGNAFTGSVTATGTRVIIRDSTALNLGAVTASTSLSATSTGNFTQSGAINVTGTGASAINATGTVTLSQNSSFGGDLSVISTAAGPATTINQTGGVLTVAGNSTFTGVGGNNISVGQANTFTGTVSFAASSGNLANVTVQDTTALDLGALDITGNLVATGAGLTQSGVFLVDGTSTLTSTGTGNNLVLANVLNQFGNGAGDTVTITSAGNATLVDSGVLEMGASTITGNLSLTAAGAFTQTGSITVNGTGTSSITTTAGVVTLGNLTLTVGNLAVSSAGNFTQAAGTSLTVSGTGTSSISTTAGNITFGNAGAAASSSFAGNLSVVSLGGTIGQATNGSITVTGTSSFNSNNGAGTIALVGSGGNNFVGAVTLTGGVTTITDGVGGLTFGTFNTGNLIATSTGVGGVLNLGQGTVGGGGILTATSAGAITQTGVINAGAVNLSVTQPNSDILLASAANNFSGTVTINAGTAGNVQDFALRNTNAGAGTVGNLGNATTNLRDLTIIYNSTGYVVPTFTTVAPLRNISLTTGGAITQAAGEIVQSAGSTTFLNSGSFPITLVEAANNFTGPVTVAGTGVVTMKDANNLTLVGQQSLNLGNITTVGAFTVSSPANITSATGSLITTGGTITITAGGNADVIIAPASDSFLGAVTVPGIFTLRTSGGTSFDIATGIPGGFDVTSTQLAKFNVGTFAPIASGGGNLNLGALTSYPGIGNINLTTTGGGNINGLGAISMNTLQLNSSGAATFSAVNQIKNLGNVAVANGGLTFRNGRGLNLTGIVTMPTGRLSLEVAGQFYNQTGQSQPLGAVAGGSVIKSLSLMGGLPNQVSGLAGFSYRFDGQMPTSGNVMSYAVSPLAMFAPGGTTIAGVDLGGTQTGGGQFNTFLTGSDNLNWMISDFGRFDMPTVKPSGMDYILYPQRVEPETRTLPAAILGNLERELGRPPTLDEIQAREVAVREAAMVRSGAILERTSFDAVEDDGDKQESAEVPVQVIDGAKPQADARGQGSEDGVQKTEVGSRPSFAPSPASAGGASSFAKASEDKSEGFGPQARKTQSVKQGANGPILRSGPMRSVAALRPAEPAEGASAGKTATQAVHLDAKSVIEQERASAEVGIAPPIAAGR
jgi:hypothetical protein